MKDDKGPDRRGGIDETAISPGASPNVRNDQLGDRKVGRSVECHQGSVRETPDLEQKEAYVLDPATLLSDEHESFVLKLEHETGT